MTRLFIFCGFIAFIGQPVSRSCPIQLSPPRVVVRYGDPVFVNCTSSVTQPEGMGWESSYGGTGLKEHATSVSWEVESLKDWEIAPKCFINLQDDTQCIEELPVTVYKMPDSVSLSQSSEMGPILEGTEHRMQCDIIDVAPVKNLSVIWYKEDEIIHTESDDIVIASPVNLSFVYNLRPQRGDNGTFIWCSAKLDFGPSGPNLPATLSKSREIIVLYPPAFIQPETETVNLSAGNKIILNCTAVGNPMPAYSWQSPNPTLQKMENEAVVTPSLQLPGTYTCTASNAYGSTTKLFIITETPRNRTALAAIVGVFVALGVLLFIGGIVFGTKEGTFSFSKGGYIRGQSTAPGPV
ncbi:hypothetical protein LDENG_00122250 [Lucifuga dentata]|nr:hypothetical protein LDENG_00122250 [Lucifuga dentata]